jgi:S-phase kinase-associated protein 1
MPMYSELTQPNVIHFRPSIQCNAMQSNPIEWNGIESNQIKSLQVSKEGDVHEVPIAVAKMSTLVATTIDDDVDDEDEVREIPLPNVKDAVLQKVIEYCTHYKEEVMTTIQTPLKSSKIEDMVQPWYASFVQVEQNLLFELVTAANFMDIKPLLDLTCLAVAVLIKGKQAGELRAMFNISNEFTPEEEAQVREENKWIENQDS